MITLLCLIFGGQAYAVFLTVRVLHRTRQARRERGAQLARRAAWNARFAEVLDQPVPAAAAATQAHRKAIALRWADAEAEARRGDRAGTASRAG